jgi:ATP phosphoribosyltransferase regulatory subunit
MLHERWQQIPAGMRDLLPAEAARVRRVIGDILVRMARWGYREVVTPTLEYLDVLVRGEGAEAGDRLFKLVDRGGELLALRPEMTVPVARLASTRLRGEPRPLRLAYAGQVFRGREAGSGRLREFPQVGCELIGSGTLEADAEIVALAVEALAAAGAPQFSVSLGHVGFLRGLLAGLDLPEEAARDVRALLYRKDFVELGSVLARHGAPRRSVEALEALPRLRGPSALGEARRLVDGREGRDVLRDLEDLKGVLQAYGVGDTVEIDLSIIRDFEYYTGIVFEGHTAAVGAPLLGGGRYDGLLERFGAPCPATGFAVRVERVLAAAPDEPQTRDGHVSVAFVEGGRDDALRVARTLRTRRLVVTVEILGRPWEQVAREAIAGGASRAVLVRPGSALVREADGRERSVGLADLLALSGTEGDRAWTS